MRKSMLVLGAVLGLAACGDQDGGVGGKAGRSGVDRNGVPILKAGLWETTSTGLGFVHTVQTCLSDPLEAQRQDLSPDGGEGCKVERADIPGGFRHVKSCDGFGLKSSIESEFTGGAEAFEFKSRIVMNESPPLESSIKGRLVGPCPAGVQEGDTVGEEKNELAPSR